MPCLHTRASRSFMQSALESRCERACHGDHVQFLWAAFVSAFFSPSALKIVTAWSRNRRGYHPHMQPSFWGTKTHQDGTLCSLIVFLKYSLCYWIHRFKSRHMCIAHNGLPPLVIVRKTCRSPGDLDCMFGLKYIFSCYLIQYAYVELSYVSRRSQAVFSSLSGNHPACIQWMKIKWNLIGMSALLSIPPNFIGNSQI